MIGACPTPTTGGAFLSTLLGYIDCQAQTIGAAGYQALANPGSSPSLALTALITIFIAIFGFRLLLGDTPTLRDGVVAIVKIGVMLLLATSWPAYRTLVYDVVVHGPAELAGAIGGRSGLPGSTGGLVERLQQFDNGLTALVTLGSGRNENLYLTPPTLDGTPLRASPTPISDDLAFGLSRVSFLTGIIGAFGIVRVGAGLLLALAPLFAGLLLFETTCGLFIGWLRSLAATILAGIAVTIISGIELALLEPWLADTLQQRFARIVTPAAPVELLIMCLSFTTILFGVLILVARVAFTMTIPAVWISRRAAANAPDVISERERHSFVKGDTAAWQPSRAHAVADAIAAVQRRETVTAVAAIASGGMAGSAAGASGPIDHRSAEHRPLGQSTSRTRMRRSAWAARRDRRT